jgi:hypothetical protein
MDYVKLFKDTFPGVDSVKFNHNERVGVVTLCGETTRFRAIEGHDGGPQVKWMFSSKLHLFDTLELARDAWYKELDVKAIAARAQLSSARTQAKEAEQRKAAPPVFGSLQAEPLLYPAGSGSRRGWRVGEIRVELTIAMGMGRPWQASVTPANRGDNWHAYGEGPQDALENLLNLLENNYLAYRDTEEGMRRVLALSGRKLPA